MSLHTLGFTLHVIGEITIAISVIRIHTRVSKEHKIDKKVISSIKQEQWITLMGILFVATGYLLELPFK